MKPTARIAFVLLAAAVVLAWLASGWLATGPRVDVVPAARGPIVESLDERAVTRLPDTYIIAAPFSGRIESIALTEGAKVREDQVVARFVPQDLTLAVDEAKAARDRLEAAIRESGDTTVETTALAQAERFVDSTKATVKASAERIRASEARSKFSERHLERTRTLIQTRAGTEDDLDQATLRQVESLVSFRQDEFVHAAMLAMQAATDLMPKMVRQYIDRKSLTAAVYQAQAVEAAARLKLAELNRSRGTMQSPVDGVVLERYVSNEGFLSAGTKLLSVGRLEDLELEADVLSVDVVQVKVGDRGEIYGPAVGLPHAAGTVTRVFPAGFTKISSLGVEQQRVKVVLRFDPNDLRRLVAQRNLGVGYRVRVRIETGRKADALVVPRSALFRGPGGLWQLLTVARGRLEQIDVAVGMMNDESAEITSGLAADDLVVMTPDSTLRPGDKVAPVVHARSPSADPAAMPLRGNGD